MEVIPYARLYAEESWIAIMNAPPIATMAAVHLVNFLVRNPASMEAVPDCVAKSVTLVSGNVTGNVTIEDHALRYAVYLATDFPAVSLVLGYCLVVISAQAFVASVVLQGVSSAAGGNF